MATLLIRNLDDRTKSRLRVRAAEHGRSMEEEARAILSSELTVPKPRKGSLIEGIRRIVEPWGGIELDIPPRQTTRDPPDFSE